MNRFGKQYGGVIPVLTGVMLLSFALSLRYGAVDLTINEIFSSLQKYLHSKDTLTLQENIFIQLRLPRALLCMIVGASLAVAGVLMQALFRNPIVEPGLIGTSSGAAFGASIYLVLGASIHIHAGEWTLAIAAGAGSIIATTAVMLLARTDETGRTSIVSLLLTGIAVNALFMSGIGFLSFIARDPQARSITFWNLGTFSGANWEAVGTVAIVFFICYIVALSMSTKLNALLLGEEEAGYLGINIKHLKRVIMLLNVLLVAAGTAFVGIIAFVGLIAPHLLRMYRGSDNRYLLTGSALMGAILLSLADLAARCFLKPAELPIGVVTSLIGVFLFIIVLKTGKHNFL